MSSVVYKFRSILSEKRKYFHLSLFVFIIVQMETAERFGLTKGLCVALSIDMKCRLFKSITCHLSSLYPALSKLSLKFTGTQI